MAWDADVVRIELHDVMTLDTSQPGRNDMKPKQGAYIWLYNEDGKPLTRKPTLKLVEADRPTVLRSLAAWIEQENDPALRSMAEQYSALAK